MNDSARALFELLRSIRELSGQRFGAQEIEQCTDILECKAAEVSQAVEAAEILQLVERTGADGYEWDPVFERLLLGK